MLGWYIFCLLSTVIGDSLILIGTIHFRAIRLNTVIVRFIQNLAVCDLIAAIMYVIPCIVALIADQWILGRLFCAITAFSSFLFLPAGCFLIMAMTTGKLLMLQFPLRSKGWSAKHANIVCGGIWVFCAGLPIFQMIFGSGDVIFDLRKYNCSYGYTKKVWGPLKPILYIIFGTLPSIIIIVSTVLLIRRALSVRSHKNIRWQGFMTLIGVASVYSISILPYDIYGVVEPLLEKEPEKWSDTQRVVYGTACFLLSINIMANFFIYSLTVISFRNFLREKVFTWPPFQRKRSVISCKGKASFALSFDIF